jgi:hypothetical protein
MLFKRFRPMATRSVINAGQRGESMMGFRLAVLR